MPQALPCCPAALEVRSPLQQVHESAALLGVAVHQHRRHRACRGSKEGPSAGWGARSGVYTCVYHCLRVLAPGPWSPSQQGCWQQGRQAADRHMLLLHPPSTACRNMSCRKRPCRGRQKVRVWRGARVGQACVSARCRAMQGVRGLEARWCLLHGDEGCSRQPVHRASCLRRQHAGVDGRRARSQIGGIVADDLLQVYRKKGST